MAVYLFFRTGGFYPLELNDDDEARANAESNPGTEKVETWDGARTVWPVKKVKTDAELAREVMAPFDEVRAEIRTIAATGGKDGDYQIIEDTRIMTRLYDTQEEVLTKVIREVREFWQERAETKH